MSTEAPRTPEEMQHKFSQIEHDMLCRGAAAAYFAHLVSSLPDIPAQFKQEAQYFLWFGRCPVNVDLDGRVS